MGRRETTKIKIFLINVRLIQLVLVLHREWHIPTKNTGWANIIILVVSPLNIYQLVYNIETLLLFFLIVLIKTIFMNFWKKLNFGFFKILYKNIWYIFWLFLLW